ncbi:thioredoxin fold domain-containing protein [Achromobacter anxifer]|uniref:thioredoxin fold domain-containing protein n=1 Tax=Achromobacter anxifer TaxID=1287737 RepID=UPI0023F7A682|nr:thioredoxin fold domain-containing protein [Achromobacter anxifer]MDF8359447.1 thioredoxin fold domain-containing protein [Achromobacter anxifer]
MQIRRLVALSIVSLAAAAPGLASAQFNIEKLVTDSVGTVISEVTSTQSKSATERPGNTTSKKPASWPAEVRWYDYSQTAPQPYSPGPARRITQKGYADSIAFDSLPLQYAFVRKRGNGARKIAVFVDPYCPYTRIMERSLNKIDNVTIYTFVAPILNATKQKSTAMTTQIACQPNNQARAQAYDNWILNDVTPAVVAPCDSVAQRIIDSLKGIKSKRGLVYAEISPTLVFDNNFAATGGLTDEHFKQILSW